LNIAGDANALYEIAVAGLGTSLVTADATGLAQDMVGPFADNSNYEFTVSLIGSGCPPIEFNSPFNCIPTPIELLDFSGTAESNHNALTWVTASEVDNDHYRVLRSRDGVSFETVGTVQGAGTSSVMSEYNFDDYDVEAGTYFYQLQYHSNSGEITFSNVITLERAGVEDFYISNLYPNPVVSTLNVTYVADRAISTDLKVIDSAGKAVLVDSFEALEGEHLHQLNVELLPKGMYYLTIYHDDFLVVQKFVKE